MTEVKSTSYAGLGLFSTQDYKEGATIITESSPLVRLAPVNDEQTAILLQMLPPSKKRKGALKDSNFTFLDTIEVPTSVPAEYARNYKEMLQAAACFAEFSIPSCHTALLELSCPNEHENKEIINVAREVLRYIQHHSKGNSSLRTTDPELLFKVILIHSSNSFAGARCYERSCRINHSCNPNCLAVSDGDAQTIVAACNISAGEELTISYLGLLLYADTQTRQSKLYSDKHFTCACPRCQSSNGDIAASVPCPTCHEREGRYLNEDVAYDDDLNVNYCRPFHGNDKYKCEICGTNMSCTDKNSPLAVISMVSSKIRNYLDSHIPQLEADPTMDDELQNQLLELATVTLGAKHWTTNLMTLLQIDYKLKEQHATMIQSGEPPLMDDLAQIIDALERLERYVVSLDLRMHMGHVLSFSMIGVARSLICLGDLKSKTYASKWIQKVKLYTDTFESEGMQKVVAAMQNAYKDGDDECEDSNKKQRRQ